MRLVNQSAIWTDNNNLLFQTGLGDSGVVQLDNGNMTKLTNVTPIAVTRVTPPFTIQTIETVQSEQQEEHFFVNYNPKVLTK